MTNFFNLNSILVPYEFVFQAQNHLQRVGKYGYEGVALWAGRIENNNFKVSETIIPDQIPLQLSSGICFFVDSEELHRINVWLYKNNLTLIAQLHSHPSEAFHSSTDDMFPIVTTLGSYSLVIPNFASQSFSIENCAVYQLSTSGWVYLNTDQAKKSIIIKG